MKKLYVVLLTISFWIISLTGFSQISQGGLPKSFQYGQFQTSQVPVQIMPSVDVRRLLAEDSVNERYKDIPWRFGENIPVSFDLKNSGRWDVLPNGDRIW